MTNSPGWKVKLAVLLCLLGAILAGISLYQHTGIKYGLQVEKSFCNISEKINCDAVNASPFAEVFGVPVASLGIWFYLALGTALLFLYGPGKTSALLALSAAVASLFSIYLFVVSAFVIGSWCVLCIGLYVINLALLVTALSLSAGRFIADVRSGAAMVAALPLAILGRGSSASAPRIAALVGLALLLFASISLSDFMLVRVIYPRAEKQEVKQAGDKAYIAWQSAPSQQLPSASSGALTGDYAKGTPGAPIEVVEFSDFECPYCRKFYAQFEELQKEFAGKVHFVFRNFPLDKSCNPVMERELHKNACNAAALARCAGEQNRFWDAVDLLFKLDLEGSFERLLEDLGTALDLDPSALKECMSSGRQLQKIREDIAAGTALGIEGTPAVWINSKHLPMANVDTMRQIFNDLLGLSSAAK